MTLPEKKSSPLGQSEVPETGSENKVIVEPKGELKQDRIIRRWGGRHLIFRSKTGGWWILPKPYILISSFRGPVWIFYGVGQIWVTHRKLREIEHWMARVPRFVSKHLMQILDRTESELAKFICYCNESGIEGTIVIERKCMEFHWTFGRDLEKEKLKTENSDQLDERFHQLVDAFLAAKKELPV